MLPGSKPQLSKADAAKLLLTFDVTPFTISKYPVVILGIRGYFKKTLGNPLANDRGIYDDALFIVTPDCFAGFNANTDPSYEKPGIATLKPGMYLYKIGQHGISGPNPYEALRQYGNVTVIRDGGKEETDSSNNRFFINIHRGGYGTTSSLGCQTIHPDQWPAFLATVKSELKQYKQEIIPYVLIEY